MPVAEAVGAHLEPYEPAADRAALEQLAGWCEQFSPIVGLEDAEPPECLLLDITAVSLLFGGEQSLAEQVARAFSRRGYWVCLAIADTVGAAWGVAHQAQPLSIVPLGQTISALAGLPIEALRISDATLQILAKLGIRQVGQLLALPRSMLAGRFEPQLLQRLNQATGVAPEQIVAFRTVPEIVVQRCLEYPVERREVVEALLMELMDQATVLLVEREQGALRLECQLDCGQADPLRLDVSLFQASAQAEHLRGLLQARLERLTLPGPVVAARLSVVLAARLQSRQRNLFGDDLGHRQELALLVDRLSSRLGAAAVVRPVLVSDAQPEYAYRYEALAGNARRKAKHAARGMPQRPLLLEPRPVPLAEVQSGTMGVPMQFRLHAQEHRVSRSWGPERIQTGWWRGNYIRRDYYRVETDAGNRFWLFRCNAHWFLHGMFD